MPPELTEEQIKAQYAEACTQLGEISFRIAQFENASNQLMQKLDNLNKAYDGLKKQAEPKAPEAVNAPVPQA